MAQYSNLKAYIEEKIYENGTQAITGDILQDVLKVMTDDLGEFYQTGGVASPSTDPGTPDAKVIYFATEAGTYTNFGGITLAAGEVALLIFETSWTKETLNVLSSANGGVKTANLADGAVTTEKIAGGAVETAKIANSAVTSGKVADGAIGTAKIADGAIGADKIAANAVESAKIKNGAVTEGKINDGAVTAGKVAANAVTTAKIADDAVTTAKLNDGAVTEDKIATDAVTSGKVKDGAIGTAKIAAGAVTHAKIGAGAVEESNIKDGAVTSDKIANGAVGSDQLAEGAFSAENLADGSVTTDKLADEAVTAEKIADGAVTAGKFANGSVTTIKLGSGAVTTEKIGDGMVTRQKLADSSVGTSKIIDGAVTTDKVADGAITDAKLENPVSVSQNTETGTDGNGTITIGGADKGKFAGADKLIHLVAMDSTYGDHLQNVGDTMYLTGGKVLKRLVAVESIQTVPYYSGAIYEYQNNLYIWNGTDLILANNTDQIPIIRNKLIKLVGMGTASSGDSGVTGVGDVFYNTSAKKLWECTEYTSPNVFSYIVVPFYDGAIYTYKGCLYIWNGESLVLTDLPLSQILFDEIRIEIGGIDSNGKDSIATNRARTSNYIKAPFVIKVNDGYQVFSLIKYHLQGDSLVYDSTITIGESSINVAENGLYRVVFRKTDNTDIDNVNAILQSFDGAIDCLLQSDKSIYNADLNSTSLWELGYYGSNGSKQDSTQRVRTKERIGNYVSLIRVQNGTQYYLIGWDSNGTFQKFWDGGKFQTTAILLTGDIDIAKIRNQNIGYTFAIFGVSESVSDYSACFEFVNDIHRLSDTINALKIDDYNNSSLWVRALINSGGVLVDSTTRIATQNFISEDVDFIKFTHNLPYYIQGVLAAYKDGAFAGFVQNDTLLIGNSASWFEIEIPIKTIREKNFGYFYKLAIRFSNDATITIDDCSNCSMQNLIQDKMDRVAFNKPIITFIDDDGNFEDFDNWKSIYDACGVCPTMALITISMTQESIAKAKQYGNLGFEFVSHTHTHPDLTTRTEEQIRMECELSIEAIRNLGIRTANPEILVYPFNYINDFVEGIVRDYFQCGIEGGENRVNGRPLDRFHIRRESILSKTRRKEVVIEGETVEVAIPKNLEEWEPFIDDLVAKNGWLVIMSHFRNSYEADHYYFDDSFIQPVVDLCQYASSRGCEILTAGAAFEKFKNKLEIGKVTDAHHYIVDCNGKIYDTME